MDLDYRKVIRIARAILEGDFDIQAPRPSVPPGIALFLGGLGVGVALGLMFAPKSGEELRSDVEDRTRRTVDAAKSKGQQFARRAQEAVSRSTENKTEAINRPA